jgi:hypothetical protein
MIREQQRYANIPVSVTRKKNVIVITVPISFSLTVVSASMNAQRHLPSVSVSATRNSENGGKCRRALSTANDTAKITYGATIL